MDAWLYHGLALFAKGDTQGFRRKYRQMTEHFATAPDLSSINALLFLGVLDPATTDDPAQLTRLAERMAVADPQEPSTPMYQGAALYRAGRYAEAARFLLRANPHLGNESGDFLTRVFLAMTHQRLQRPEAARKSLGSALQIYETQKEENWIVNATGQMLGEAKALIEVTKPTGKD